MKSNKINLKVFDEYPYTAYLQLPEHPGRGKYNVVKSQINIREIIENYKGPDIYLDFNHDDTLIGIEILEDS